LNYGNLKNKIYAKNKQILKDGNIRRGNCVLMFRVLNLKFADGKILLSLQKILK